MICHFFEPEERKREIDHYLKNMKDNLFLK